MAIDTAKHPLNRPGISGRLFVLSLLTAFVVLVGGAILWFIKWAFDAIAV